MGECVSEEWQQDGALQVGLLVSPLVAMMPKDVCGR
jgi:hypothetical protein